MIGKGNEKNLNNLIGFLKLEIGKFIVVKMVSHMSKEIKIFLAVIKIYMFLNQIKWTVRSN